MSQGLGALPVQEQPGEARVCGRRGKRWNLACFLGVDFEASERPGVGADERRASSAEEGEGWVCPKQT